MSIEGVAAWALHLDEEQVAEFRIVWWLSCIQELLAWHRGAVLYGFAINERDEEWLLVVRASLTAGNNTKRYEVCFTRADSMWGCFRLFAHQLHNNTAQWKADKYPPT